MGQVIAKIELTRDGTLLHRQLANLAGATLVTFPQGHEVVVGERALVGYEIQPIWIKR